MEFHSDARDLLRRATIAALLSGAEMVQVEHLLGCNPDHDLAEPRTERAIVFSPEVLEILNLAGEQAAHDSSNIVWCRHLELALLRVTARVACWSEFHSPSPGTLRKLAVVALRHHPFAADLALLARANSGWTRSQEEAPLSSLDRARFLLCARKFATGLADLPALVLLRHLLSDGPAGRSLAEAGLTPEKLIEVLEGQIPAAQATRMEIPHRAVDLQACLGVGIERVSEESRGVLSLAWLLRDSEELRGRDLLRALIASSNQMEERNIHSLLVSLRPGNRFVRDLDTVVARERMKSPVFSAEAYRVIHAAMVEAGSGQVSNLDLLIGLAECGQELLTAEGIHAAEIRQRWAEGF